MKPYLFNVALEKEQCQESMKSHVVDKLLVPLSPLTSLILIRCSSCSAGVSGAGPEQDDT